MFGFLVMLPWVVKLASELKRILRILSATLQRNAIAPRTATDSEGVHPLAFMADERDRTWAQKYDTLSTYIAKVPVGASRPLAFMADERDRSREQKYDTHRTHIAKVPARASGPRKCLSGHPDICMMEDKMNNKASREELDFIREALTQFNNSKVGEDGHTPLGFVEYDNNGNIIGGIVGGTYWGWMYIDILWVHENHRKQGIGSKLLCEAEKEAVRRGCHHVHLDTMSWQAPDFYKKHGYDIIGVLPDIPAGNQKYLLMKAL